MADFVGIAVRYQGIVDRFLRIADRSHGVRDDPTGSPIALSRS
jgi:hypothetical protein